ncbi:MAG: phosphatase PAP2 family protein, partial [Candidatus Saccharibacteria bacterium]
MKAIYFSYKSKYCKLGWLVLAIALAWAFSDMAGFVMQNKLAPFDEKIIHLVRSLTSPGLTSFMMVVTEFGTFPLNLIIACVAAVVVYRHSKFRFDAVMPLLVLGGSWQINDALKEFFHRNRPVFERLAEASGYSFPSGHSMHSMALYGFLAYMVWISSDKASLRWGSLVLAALLIAIVGISRIYLGVHYPSDVIGGFAAGGLWLFIC